MRLIDADLIQYEPMLSPKGNGQYEEVSVAYKSQIDDLPTIEERKKGEWIRHPEVKNIYGGEYIECSECGEKYVVQHIMDEKFCRNCGADMRKIGADDTCESCSHYGKQWDEEPCDSCTMGGATNRFERAVWADMRGEKNV